MRAGILLLVSNLILCGNTFAQSPDHWPEPPRQHAKWQPDEAVPVKLRSAVETLFEQGFPDPRDCEYREIEIEVSGLWPQKSSRIKTHGWVLPETSGLRCAIAWNGAMYPIKTLGAAADLQNDLASLTRPTPHRFNQAVGETRSVFATNSLSSRVLLLLRLGETDAALKNWAPDQQTMSQIQPDVFPSGTNIADAYDPYLELAGDWAWALFDQILSAHMRGDETLALASARQLAEAQPKIEAEAARRGYRRPQDYSSRPSQAATLPYLTFLEQFPDLLRDLERRSHDGPRFAVMDSELKKLTNQTERIRVLIHDLDLVQARQYSQPGGVSLSDDFIVAALIDEGDAAVEPLLHCLETDQRLTRSVSFHRDFFRRRHVLPVSAAAKSALEAILQTRFTGSAREIRYYWNRFKNFPLEERWYEMLKDDSAGMERWNEAAANIVRPENIDAFAGPWFRMKQKAPVSTNTPVKMRGESLRSKSDPTVSELLTRRATGVSDKNPERYDLATACEIALALADWDLPAALPAARELVNRCRAVMEYSNQPDSWPQQRLGIFIARLTSVRARCGDNRALVDYAEWLKQMTPKQLDSYLSESLEPLGEFATNQAIQTVAENLFSNTNSPWGRLPWKASGFFNPVSSKLIRLPAFRSLVIRELDDTSVVGSVNWQPPQMIRFQMTNVLKLGGSRMIALPETNRPAGETNSDLRWCDWIALSLAETNAIPPFNPFASMEQRNRAIDEAKARLARP